MRKHVAKMRSNPQKTVPRGPSVDSKAKQELNSLETKSD
jgi:hypothetical protein